MASHSFTSLTRVTQTAGVAGGGSWQRSWDPGRDLRAGCRLLRRLLLSSCSRGSGGFGRGGSTRAERGKLGLACLLVLSELEDEDPNFELPSKAQQHVWGQRLFGQMLLTTRGPE